MIKDRELFLCARPDGDIAPAQVSGEGFYAYDTRYLSEIGLEVGGARPVALSYAAVDDRAVVDSTNATSCRRGSLEPIPQLSLSMTRELMIASGRLYYLVRLRNFLREPVTTTASLALAADFADMFEVRGGVRRSARGHALAPKRPRTRAGARVRRRGRGLPRVDHRALSDAGCSGAGCGSRARPLGGRARAGQAGEMLMTAEPSIGGRRRPRRRRTPTAAEDLERARADWFASCTQIRSDNELFDGLIATTIRDLRALIMPAPGGQIVSAGNPWYVAAFGRDALVTAGEAMLLNPATVARRVARARRGCRRQRTTPGATLSRARSCTSFASASSPERG